MLKVLLIDDSPTIIMAITRKLEAHGIHVTSASTMSEIVAATPDDDDCYDAIVLDVNMPVVDGKTVREKLINWGCCCGIIYYSGEPSEKLVDLVGTGGCYVIKDADVTPLADRIVSCSDRTCPGNNCYWMNPPAGKNAKPVSEDS